MAQNPTWNENELVVAFHLYCQTPFGKIHHNNPKIMEVAKLLGRSPAALSMKMCNFASFDPAHKSRNVGGLKHAGRGDKDTWDKYSNNWSGLLEEYRKQMAALHAPVEPADEEVEVVWNGKRTEAVRTVKARLGQRFFRGAVLASYDYKCAMCQIGVPQLLNASHIIPWSASKERRVDPRNGLSLCGLHDRAFDKGLVTVDEDCRLMLSREIKKRKGPEVYAAAFTKLEGARLVLPARFAPDSEALEYHRRQVFMA
ncbi:MAG TPA: HNH endonuclease [Sedimentisphaerales bacterium]|nr:HNH endonuclease [Sedimentisphaerales bacterium]